MEWYFHGGDSENQQSRRQQNLSKVLHSLSFLSMIGGLTAGQFAIFDSMLPAIGIDKFHYHEPHAEH